MQAKKAIDGPIERRAPEIGQRYERAERALAERWPGLRGILPFLGPAFIASVAYIDPGNYATNIAAGSTYGYRLLWVVLAANLMAILVQALSAKLGIATGRDLPELIRDRYGAAAGWFMWVQGELVVIFTDLAEFLGGAIGIHLLTGRSMVESAVFATILSFLLLELQRRGVRPLEAAITGLVMVVTFSFVVEMFLSGAEPAPLMRGLLVPTFPDAEAVFLAAGILGATVMPHAIYLHSALTKRRVTARTPEEKKRLYRLELLDLWIAMGIAGVINMSMVIVAAALFHGRGMVVEEIDDAARLLGQFLGPAATLLFAVGLLASGLSSSSVGILAGDVIMQGFIRFRIPIYARRIVSTIPPLAIILSGMSPTTALLVSQVVLSFGIGLALVPLVLLTRDRRVMGELANRPLTNLLAYAVTAVVLALNGYLLYSAFHGVAV
ncbi:Nramp family divalent metal transporter [Hydrogenibacillus sp. N12]|uniref:Nramp family divalent metal transporter n=1 Tax=Hydrogenibacillus sp. N12 TaxID=2866627 RepID=UPI001C7CC7ED|nr:Nramp family divalent metal transporter [Hydrogenibacillus sp. N12]QZA33196.1 Nramp family divalent metal transporter [Hydrogenibacillus sp. N12]